MAIKLHYGQQTFSLPDGQAGFLSDYDGSPQIVDVALSSGGTVRLFLGPGVPVAVEQVVPGKVRVIR